MSTIAAPRLTVLMDDGKTHTVKVPYRAQLQYGRTARMRKWPTIDKAPELVLNFLAWYTLTQVEKLYDYPYEEFEEHVEWLQDGGEEELEPGDEDFPTQ